MFQECLAFDDVQIVPKYSEVLSRSDCDTKTKVSRNYSIDIPIVSAPMDKVTEWEMAVSLYTIGGLGFIHRFMSIDRQVEQVQKVDKEISFRCFSSGTGRPPVVLIGAAIGATKDYLERAQELVNNGVNILLIDVAHGHHIHVKNALNLLKKQLPNNVDVIAGNIATVEAAFNLINWGADGLRVGLGNGSLCITRLQTGIGVPQISALMSINDTATKEDVPIISDGGVKYSCDIAKAIVAGADTVMIGSMLAGTKEAPGSLLKKGVFPNEVLYKEYRGSASQISKSERGEDSSNIEGVSTVVKYKGKVKRIVDGLVQGLKSSMSYVGARDLKTFRSNAEFIRVTQNGSVEAQPHLLIK